MSAEEHGDIGAIIVAAGRSERMGSVDKLWAEIADSSGHTRPLIAYSIATFAACPAVDRIVIVTAAGTVDRASGLARDEGWDKVCAVVPGGARRQDSVRAGLAALHDVAWVVVHDAARPLITAALIERSLAEARETGAACCAIAVPDTVKERDDGGFAARTLDRSRLWLAQTPQAFRHGLLADAHRQAAGDATDDAALVEALGVKVRLCPGSTRNVKVTSPEDLVMVQALLRSPA